MRKSFVFIDINGGAHTINDFIIECVDLNGMVHTFISSNSAACTTRDESKRNVGLEGCEQRKRRDYNTKSDFVRVNHVHYTWWTFSSWFSSGSKSKSTGLSSLTFFSALFFPFVHSMLLLMLTFEHKSLVDFEHSQSHSQPQIMLKHKNMWKN